MLLRIQEFLVRHWLPVGFFTILFVSLPEWIGSVWGLFYAEPIFHFMAKRLSEMNMPSFSPYWITIPLSICMFAVILYVKLKEQAPAKEPETRLNHLPAGYISLHEAVDKLHKAAKQGKIPMMGAESMSGGTLDNFIKPGSEEEIYAWWAIRIAKDDEIEMRGRRPPGDIERVGKRIKRDFLFVDKATRLKDPMNDDVYYTDLCVRAEALEASYDLEYGFHQE